MNRLKDDEKAVIGVFYIMGDITVEDAARLKINPQRLKHIMRKHNLRPHVQPDRSAKQEPEPEPESVPYAVEGIADEPTDTITDEELDGILPGSYRQDVDN